MKEAIAPQPEWIVSVDDHIIEPEDLWTGRLRAKDRERAPHFSKFLRQAVNQVLQGLGFDGVGQLDGWPAGMCS